ncbi:MAG TPA: hypothetical protein VFV54_05235 [Thermoanaerobaculia bacterium]|nr:hypothetical protein [Thermoanaerobaculia bacterium]
MPESNLIPGVEGPRHSAVNARQLEIERQRARRRESVEELLDCAVLIVVNLVFLLWSEAKVPFLDRDTTMIVLLLANLFTIGSYVRSRVLPRWKARRIAATWSAAERERFAAHAR